MKKIGIFYGSSTGTTQDIAERIGEQLQVNDGDIRDIGDVSITDLEDYDLLILGSSTWGDGDLQDEWEEVSEGLSSLNLSGKQVALFGCGDGSSYGDSFCSAIGILYKLLSNTKCAFIGAVDSEGYDFDASDAFIEGRFVGLPLDEDNESDLTKERLDSWVSCIKSHLA